MRQHEQLRFGHRDDLLVRWIHSLQLLESFRNAALLFGKERTNIRHRHRTLLVCGGFLEQWKGGHKQRLHVIERFQIQTMIDVHREQR